MTGPEYRYPLLSFDEVYQREDGLAGIGVGTEEEMHELLQWMAEVDGASISSIERHSDGCLIRHDAMGIIKEDKGAGAIGSPWRQSTLTRHDYPERHVDEAAAMKAAREHVQCLRV